LVFFFFATPLSSDVPEAMLVALALRGDNIGLGFFPLDDFEAGFDPFFGGATFSSPSDMKLISKSESSTSMIASFNKAAILVTCLLFDLLFDLLLLLLLLLLCKKKQATYFFDEKKL
jgi:hypothetical protein